MTTEQTGARLSESEVDQIRLYFAEDRPNGRRVAPLFAHIDALAAENAELRAALEAIADSTWPPGYSISAARGMVEQARAALAGRADRGEPDRG